jgi:hypothetical protein
MVFFPYSFGNWWFSFAMVVHVVYLLTEYTFELQGIYIYTIYQVGNQ